MAIFEENLKEVIEHNSNPEAKYQKGLNKYSDQTYEEWSRHYLNAPLDKACVAMNQNQNAEARMLDLMLEFDYPESLDWRAKGGVSPVKDQGHCGSCWTFATVGTLESRQLIKYKQFVANSEQQIVDCAYGYGDDAGCNGGLPPAAMEYIRHAGGIMSEADYPYKAVDQKCQFDINKVKVTVPKGSVNITEGDEVEMLHALYNHGPVAIGFEVIPDFRAYKSGVFHSEKCGTSAASPNHNVLLIGYGKEDGMDYWLLKNSWGPNWGDQGFFKLQRGVNMCAIGMCNGYPVEVDLLGATPRKGYGSVPAALLD